MDLKSGTGELELPAGLVDNRVDASSCDVICGTRGEGFGGRRAIPEEKSYQQS